MPPRKAIDDCVADLTLSSPSSVIHCKSRGRAESAKGQAEVHLTRLGPVGRVMNHHAG